jgi:predicted enzyme related to lactoylglutathione lyase
MSYVNVMPSLQVSEFDATVEWYERLIGREPDRRPMDGCVEWQLAPTGGIQVYRNPETPVAATLIVGVDDIDAEVPALAGRGIMAEPYDVPTGQFRIAQLQDPAGNTVVLAQDLT